MKTSKLQQVTALLELGWTYRRIEAETGVRRETISRYDRLRHSKAAKVFPGSQAPITGPNSEFEGSDPAKPAKVTAGSGSNPAKVFPGSNLPPRSSASMYHNVIVSKLDAGLSIQRIWQDLVEEYGFGYSYERIGRTNCLMVAACSGFFPLNGMPSTYDNKQLCKLRGIFPGQERISPAIVRRLYNMCAAIELLLTSLW